MKLSRGRNARVSVTHTDTLHPTPFTLHPTTHTPNPLPSAIHPTSRRTVKLSRGRKARVSVTHTDSASHGAPVPSSLVQGLVFQFFMI